MKALKLNANVDRSRRLVLELPEEIGEGPVEVIVLVPESRRPGASTLAEHLASLERGHRTVAEIDEQIRVERQSWD